MGRTSHDRGKAKNQIFWGQVKRPLATYGSEILALSRSATPAIPSEHTTKSVALALPFILLVSNSKNLHKGIKVVIGLIAAGVCFSRIVLGAHYLSDGLAGTGMALIRLPLSMLFVNTLLCKMKGTTTKVLLYMGLPADLPDRGVYGPVDHHEVRKNNNLPKSVKADLLSSEVGRIKSQP